MKIEIKKLQERMRLFFYGVLFLFCVFIIATIVSKYNRQLSVVAPRVQKTISKKEKVLHSWVDDLKIPHSDGEVIMSSFSINTLKSLEKDGVSLFFFLNDSLAWWTDKNIPIGETFDSKLFEQTVAHLQDGWYLCHFRTIDNLKILGLSLVKYNYRFENQYLPNNFAPDIKLPADVEISLRKTDYPIYSSNGVFCFGLKYSGALPMSRQEGFFLFVFFMSFVFLFLYWLKLFWSLLFYERKKYLVLSYVLVVAVFRFIFFIFRIPAIMFETEMFQPYEYAISDLFPSLGDTFFSLLCFLHCLWVIFTQRDPSNFIRRKKKTDFLSAVVLILLANACLYFFVLFLRNFTQNSKFELMVDNLLSADEVFVTLAAFLFMAGFAAYMLFWKFSDIAVSFTRSISKHIYAISVGLVITFIFCLLQKETSFYFLLFASLVLHGIYLIANWRGIAANSIIILIIIPYFFAIFSTSIILHYSFEKEHQYKEFMLEKLSIEENPPLEVQFSKARKEITRDSILHTMLHDNVPENIIHTYIKRTYFSNKWDIYNVNIAFCSSTGNTKNNIAYCKKEFEKKLQRRSKETNIEGLYSIVPSTNQSNLYYAEPITLMDKYGDTVLVCIEFTLKDYERHNILLMSDIEDDIFNVSKELEKYSYAKYINGQLVKSSGDYFYPTKLPEMAIVQPLNFKAYVRNGYEHSIYTTENPKVVWILSSKEVKFENYLRASAHLFLIFFLFRLLIYPLTDLSMMGGLFDKRNFRRYFQFVFIVIIIVPFVAIGILFTYYFNIINNVKERDFLAEKSSFVVTDFKTLYNSANEIEENRYNLLIEKAKQCAEVHKCDISVFSLDGKLITSSSMDIYEEGIAAPLMNPIATKMLENDELPYFNIKEQIGSRKYVILYFPLKNENNKIIAYISSAYFTESPYFQKQILPFLFDYAYLYILIILCALIVLSFVTRDFMKPVLLLKQRMHALSLGKKNEKIQTNSIDEFGDLIRSYNQMVDKLEENTYLLAKSEREGAWRGIAKRIAHEIKNPLTPMNLSMQQLLRLWNDKSPEFENRFATTSQMLIDQIKVLSSVVDEFSYLAQKPYSNNERVNLVATIQQIISMYENYKNVRISLAISKGETYDVLADSQQLCRAFLNIVKNAIQATVPGDVCDIKIRIEKYEKVYIVHFSDDGIGIPKAKQGLIFKSHFTTKDDGTGLGLSIVKATIEGFSGAVDFYSNGYEGTTFIITLPIYKDSPPKK